MADKRIKGITVEINGKTTGLEKALKSANTEIKKAQNHLRDIQSALKLDPKNVDLLKAKQTALNAVIAETKKKLDMEKEAAVNAKKALETGEITQQEYDALQAEIVRTTDKLKGLEKQARQSASVLGSVMQSVGDDIKKVGDNIQAAGDKIQNVGATLTKKLTVPILATGTASVSAFKEVDAGLDIVIKKTGATGEALEEMQDITKNIAQDIPASFEEAGSAVGEVNTRFGITGDNLEVLSAEFIKFSQLNNTDVSNSIDNVQKVMAAYNVDVKDATKLLDSLNATGQKTGIDMDTLTSLMVTNSAALQQMGFNAYSASNFLGSVEMSGADTSQVMTGLTKALKNASEQGIPLDEALSQIQDSMLNAESEAEGLQYAYELFGTKAGAAVYQACKNGSLSFKDLSASMESTTGSIDKTYDSMMDGTDEMTKAWNSVKISASELGKTISETLAPIIQTAASKVRQLGETWKGLSEEQKQTVLKIIAIVAALGPLIQIISKIIAVVGGAISIIGTITSAIGTAVTFIKGTVIPAISAISPPIIAIGLAITAIITIIKNWSAVVELVQIVAETVFTKIKEIIIDFKEFWTMVFEGIAYFFTSIWKNISETAINAWTAIQNVFANVGTWFTEKFQQAWNGITGIFSKLGEFFKGVWDTITGIFTTIGTTIADAITGSVKSAVNSVLSGAIGIINGFISAINVAISVINAIPGVEVSKLKSLSVPQLELGGILKKGQVGLLEGNGAEAVVPLDKNKAWVAAVAKDFRDALDTRTYPQPAPQQQPTPAFAGDIIIPVSLGGNKLGQVIVKANQIKDYKSGGR